MSNKNRALLFDLIFLTLVSVAGEVISHMAVTKFSVGYYFSITLIIAFVAIYRIGALGVIPALAVGIVFCIINEGATLETYMVYIGGNMAILSAAMFLKISGRDKIKENSVWAILYIITGYISIIIVRGLIGFALDPSTNLISALFLILSNEFLSMIAVTVLFSLVSKRKQLMIDINALYIVQEPIADPYEY